ALADREQVEDRPDVRVERVVALAGEDLAAAGQARHARRGDLPVVLALQRPRADVVRRRRAAGDDPGGRADGLLDRVRLHGVAEEEVAGLPAEAEAVDDLRLPVAGAVDLDVVPGAWRERVVVRPRGRILTGDPVRDDGEGVRLVRAAERVEVRVVGGRILRDQRRLPVA